MKPMSRTPRAAEIGWQLLVLPLVRPASSGAHTATETAPIELSHGKAMVREQSKWSLSTFEMLIPGLANVARILSFFLSLCDMDVVRVRMCVGLQETL